MDLPLLQERRGSVALLTLNRPDRRNALSATLVSALRAALGADPEARAVVLTGAGTHFCAGGDLAPDGSLAPGLLAQHDARGEFALLVREIATARRPVIAAVNGDALGGGFGLAAACHLVVAAEGAKFGTPEIKVGLFPMMIGPVLARNLPRKVLYDVVLTGRRLGAAEARDLGFVNRVAADPVAEALALGEAVAACSPAVVGLGLRALATVEDLDLDAALAHMHAALTLNLLTEDAAEGISAFLSRRPPHWKGC